MKLKAHKAYFAMLLAALVATPASAGDQDFVLVNDTGYTVERVYVSPANASRWGQDVLDEDTTLEDGMRANISFSRSEETCLWDLKVEYEDGETAEWQAFDLCGVSVIAISYDHESGRTHAKYE